MHGSMALRSPGINPESDGPIPRHCSTSSRHAFDPDEGAVSGRECLDENTALDPDAGRAAPCAHHAAEKSGAQRFPQASFHNLL